MRKLKILNYHHLYLPSLGGIEENIYTFAKYSRHEHLVYTDLLPATQPIESIGNTTVYRYGPAKHPIRHRVLDQAINLLLDLPRELNKALNLNKIDFNILHLRASFTFPALFYILDHMLGRTIFKKLAAWRLCKKPVVVTFHSLPSHDLPIVKFFPDVPYYPQTEKYRRAWLGIEKKYCERAEALICVDRYMVEPLKRLCPHKRVIHIPSAIDTDMFKPMDKEEALKRLSKHIRACLDNSNFKVLYLGRLTYTKGAHLLRSLAKLLPQSQIVVVGDGEVHLVKGVVNMTPIGKIDNNEAQLLYNSCDVVFNPVLWHGTSRVTFEAMACGKPIIMLDRSTDRYPAVHMKNIVIADTIKEAAEFVEELRVNDSLRDGLCRNAMATAKKYSVQNLVKKVDDIYEKVYLMKCIREAS